MYGATPPQSIDFAAWQRSILTYFIYIYLQILPFRVSFSSYLFNAIDLIQNWETSVEFECEIRCIVGMKIVSNKVMTIINVWFVNISSFYIKIAYVFFRHLKTFNFEVVYGERTAWPSTEDSCLAIPIHEVREVKLSLATSIQCEL